MTEPRSVLDVLLSLKMLQGISEAHVRKLSVIASLEAWAAGEVLFSQSSHNDRFYLVVRGLVALDMTVPRRAPVRVLTVGPGEILAWSALLGSGTMTTAAVVVQDAMLVALPGQPLRALCQSDHEVGYLVMERVAQALSRRLLATRLQLLDVFAETTPLARPLSQALPTQANS
jgi:CRP/FNR family transcriptional regulator, cyclic AMP receptor protein